MFMCYYIAWPCDLDLWTLRVFRVQCFSCPTHIPIFIILPLSVTELRVLIICSHFRYLKQSLRMRRVTWWPLTGGKNSPHFLNPWPQFAYSLCHFQGATTKIKPCYRQKIAFSHFHGATTKIKPCYRQKIAFSHYEGYKFAAHAQYHVTCAQEVPQNHT